MKPVLSISALLIFLLAFQACAPTNKVYSEQQPGTNMYQFNTFNWMDQQPVMRTSSGTIWMNDHSEASIRIALEKQMNKLGYRRCENAPDLMVYYHVVGKKEVVYVRDLWCEEAIGSDAIRCELVNPVEFRKRTLLIALIDSRNGSEVWRGAVSGALDQVTADQIYYRVDQAVKMIFKNFPEKRLPGA
ncbi:MAG TPA: DUF4136 domain-containing protein [Saprospiraceae bacterium]|nr:DUF4136 domain-containing protein [Saprospiraceae bacterium]HPI05835.1 DUF4136 domain-containing protein [Saprospiraceae bacterium]